MTTAFERALRAHFAPSAAHPQYDHWLAYALGSVARGEELVAKLQREFLPELAGKAHLDVGSGWGGTCLAAARAGMRSVGIEPGADQRRVAEVHREDQPGLPLAFLDRDAMDWAQLADLGRFDLITVDNVIEHVPCPERLLAHLGRLLAPGGLVYLTAPNAWAVEMVESDCHYGLFGASLLDPAAGAAYVREAIGHEGYDVSWYYPYERYEALAQRYGLATRFLLPEVAEPGAIAALRARAARLPAAYAAAAIPAGSRAALDAAFAAHQARLATDLAWYDGDPGPRAGGLLMRDYGYALWYLVLAPADAPPPPAHDARPRWRRTLGAAWRAWNAPPLRR